MSQTATMTETAPPPPTLTKPFLFSISEKNETAYSVKKIFTGMHFVSMIAAGFLYVLEDEHRNHCIAFSVLCLVLATFIPPTGLIPPEDAPDYAKKSMSYREGFGEAPTKGATLEQRVTQLEKRTKKKSKSAKKNK